MQAIDRKRLLSERSQRDSVQSGGRQRAMGPDQARGLIFKLFQFAGWLKGRSLIAKARKTRRI